MRYSMKWILAAMVYVAIAAAAFSQPGWVYADLLWAATFLAFSYAIIVAWLVPGVARARAGGFVIVAACFVASLHLSPVDVPARRVLEAIRVMLPADSVDREPTTVSEWMASPRRESRGTQIRSADTVATMLSGLVGCLLGSLAYNRARRDALR